MFPLLVPAKIASTYKNTIAAVDIKNWPEKSERQLQQQYQQHNWKRPHLTVTDNYAGGLEKRISVVEGVLITFSISGCRRYERLLRSE